MKNGGSAFPAPTEKVEFYAMGMSLRDYWMGQAILAVKHIDFSNKVTAMDAVEKAALLVDAMLAERDKQDGGKE